MTTKPQVIHGTGAAMDELQDGSAQLILTSPPYFPDEMEGQFQGGFANEEKSEQLANEICRFAVSLRPIFNECARILADDGVFVLQTRDVRLGDRLVGVESIHRTLIEATGLVLYTRYLWRPRYVTHTRRSQLKAASAESMPRAFDPEVFLVFKHPGAKSHGQPAPDDVAMLEADIVTTPKGNLFAPHKYQAPLPMLEAIVRSWTQPDQLVVDPFCGGGSTLLVAYRLGRQAVGYEIDAKSVELARQNVEAEP
jgi:DNA modification methylase